MAAVRRELEAIDPGLTLFGVQSIGEHLDRFRVMLRWSSTVNGSFGAFRLIVADLGRMLAVGTSEPLIVVGGPMLATLTLLACYLPARGSTRIDPLVALREE